MYYISYYNNIIFNHPLHCFQGILCNIAFSSHHFIRRYKVSSSILNIPLCYSTSFIHSFIQQTLLSIFYVPGIMLGTKNTAMSKTT